MSKIFVFGIGGTGSRVMRALTMLLASGVKTNATEIVPIIIDPDSGCGDKTGTIDLMNKYISVYKTQNQASNRSVPQFSTKLTKLPFSQDFVMPIGGITSMAFGQYMQFASLNETDQALVNMLYSDDNQNVDMEIGFTGNPNIGSMVLNQFDQSNEFNTFASNFVDGDKIFIISSIFGGSGASGFPLLLKNLRNAANIGGFTPIPNAHQISHAEIGALTVLPYFNIAPPQDKDNEKIVSDTFISKAKAALSYYEHNLDGLTALYYIGDDARGQQEYNDGGPLQQNDPNFVELASALAIIDFANSTFSNPTQTVYREFGIENDVTDITMKDLSRPTAAQIARPLTQFTIFSKYLTEKFYDSTDQTWVSTYSQAMNSSAYQELLSLSQAFLDWEKGMESGNHSRRFTPFYLEARPGNVFDLVKGVKPHKVLSSASNWDLVNSYLNKNDSLKQAGINGNNHEGKFIGHMLYGINQVVKDKIKF